MENINMGPHMESEQEKQARLEAEFLADFLSKNPDTEISPENKREAGPEIEEVESLLSKFETDFSLDELHAIVDITTEDAINHPVRKPAKLAVNVILTKIDVLHKETNISPEKEKELRDGYKKLSRAIGILSNNKLDHTR